MYHFTAPRERHGGRHTPRGGGGGGGGGAVPGRAAPARTAPACGGGAAGGGRGALCAPLSPLCLLRHFCAALDRAELLGVTWPPLTRMCHAPPPRACPSRACFLPGRHKCTALTRLPESAAHRPLRRRRAPPTRPGPMRTLPSGASSPTARSSSRGGVVRSARPRRCSVRHSQVRSALFLRPDTHLLGSWVRSADSK